MPPHPMHQQRTTSDSSFSKLKHWFNKGSELQSDNKASHQAKRKQQRDMGATRYVAAREVCTANGAATGPYPVSQRGPRLPPQAVYVGARSNTSEGDNMSIFSSLRSSPASSLTSAQSHKPLEQPQRSKPTKPQTGALQISLPQPRQSLLDLAAQYTNVQNPKKDNGINGQPTPLANVKLPPHGQDEQRPEIFQPDRPIKDVSQGWARVVTPPTHQRSQKTVVRKMEPQQAHKTDNNVRQVYRETRFEDFMGKAPPAMPSLPANASSLVPSPSADSRLSRPFAAANEYEESADDARPSTASTAALSRSDSRAQTWLRYDRKHGESAQEQNTDAPLFPRRNLTVPDRDQHFKYNPCQTCRRQVHPSTAFSYNGTYLCEDCAATGTWGPKKKEHIRPKKDKISRKLIPTSPRTPLATPSSTSSTLRGTLSPAFSPRQPRIRRTDVPPGNEYGYLQPPNASSQAPSPTPSSTFTSSPQIPYFATPNAEGKFPRYRTPPPPPPPPIHTSTSIPSNELLSPPPPTSPLRKPQPASSIYPSTPWRLSRPPSIPDVPAVPDWYLASRGEEDGKERDTLYRAEVEEDIIDAYAGDSPVSEVSEVSEGEEGLQYVNAPWRTRGRNVI
ncbi:MAG: hypothetical protein Q9213_007490 [Squamulea squamosa]